MFFKKIKGDNKENNVIKVAALLIHAAKIDENYSDKEEKIIKETLIKIDGDIKDIDKILQKAKEIETNTNQILDFTKEVKSMDDKDKIRIVETLWRIIYSNKVADIYETNLMRRLGGLLYIDSTIMGNIKEKIKKEN